METSQPMARGTKDGVQDHIELTGKQSLHMTSKSKADAESSDDANNHFNVYIDLDDDAHELGLTRFYNYWILHLVAVGLILFLTRFVQDYEIGSDIFVLNISLISLCVAYCVSVVLIAIYLKNCRGDSSKDDSFPLWVNYVMGIGESPCVKRDYDERQRMFALYHSSSTYHGVFLLTLFFHTAMWQIAGSLLDWPWGGSEIASDMSFTMSIVAVVLHRGQYSMDAERKMINLEKEIDERYSQSHVVDKVSRKLTEALAVWQSTKLIRNRKVECLIVSVVMLILRVLFFLTRDAVGAGGHVLGIVLAIMDAFFASSFCITIHELFYHYTFAAVIMKQFGASIHCQSIDDLLAWWELRKYYNCYPIKVYAEGISPLVGAGLLCAGLSLYFSLIAWLDKDINAIGLAFCALYAVSGAIILVAVASSYHGLQLSHSIMLNKERLRIQKIEDLVATNAEESEKDRIANIQKTIDFVSKDIMNNSPAMTCFGVNLNKNFLLFLRASVISITVAVLTLQSSS